MIVLVNPITKRPTAFAPNDNTPRYFDGQYQNVTEVTDEWVAAERSRLFAELAIRERGWQETADSCEPKTPEKDRG